MKFKGSPILATVAVALTLATIATAAFALRSERQRRDQADADRISALQNAAAALTSKTSGRLQDIAVALDSARLRERPDEFRHIAAAVIEEPEIAGIRLIERVESDQTAAYERARGFNIVKAGGGDANPNRLHYVSAAAVMRGGTPTHIGLDLSDNTERMKAIRAAIDSGRPIGTPPVPLLSGGEGIVVFVPIYRAGAPTATTGQRRRAAIGAVSASLRNALFADAIHAVVPDVANFRITDNKEPVAAFGRIPGSGGPTDTFEFAQRKWAIATDRTNGSAWAFASIIAFGGVALGALLLIAMLRARRQEHEANANAIRQNAELTAANAALAEYARYFELAQDLVCTTDFQGNMITFNERWSEVLGWSGEELRSLPVEERVHPEDVERVKKALDQLSRGDSVVHFRNRRLTKGGDWRWFEWSCIGDLDREMIYSSARDITDQVALEEELAFERSQLVKAQSIAQVGNWSIDTKSGATHGSDELFSLLGVERKSGDTDIEFWLDALPDDERDRARKQLSDAMTEGGDFELTFRRLRPGDRGEPVYLTASGFAERDRNGDIVRLAGVLADVTERRHREQQLRHIADHDPLTGLANRRRFDAALEMHVEQCRRYGKEGALLMLDLDGLKKINDEQGHAAGDSLITSAADALRIRLRASDLGARVGGDEFAILLTKTTREGAVTTAESILQAIKPASEQLRSLGVEAVNGSIGLVMLEDAPDLSPDMLLRYADEAMYEAKRGGRGQVKVYRRPQQQVQVA